MSGANMLGEGKGPTRGEIRAQLDAMLGDRLFAGADRISRMLRYLVETTLEGSTADLKEYSVGIDVFDRDPSFDPRNDSVVRVHGSRVRSKLAEYYGSTGAADPIIIDLPRGGYVPTFRYRVDPSAERKVIALEPRPIAVPAATFARSKPRKTVVLVTAGALLLLAAATLVWMDLRSPVQPERFVVRPVTALEGNQKYPSFSPDGSQLVFAWEGENRDNIDLYVTIRSGGPVRRITTDPDADVAPSWSPDGRSIAFRRGEHSVMVTSPLGGPERKIADTDGRFLAWAPGGEWILIAKREPDGRNFALFQVSVSTGEQLRLTTPDEKPDGYQPFAISPDNKWLAYSHRDSPGAAPDLFVRPLSGGTPKPLTHIGYQIRGWAWTPDSQEIVFASNSTGIFSLWRIAVSGRRNQPAPIPDTLDASYPTLARGVPADTPLLVFERQTFRVGLREIELRSGSAIVDGVKPILASTRVESSPQFSPDGKWIAFVSNRTGFEEIWRSDAAGHNPVALTSFGIKGESPGSPRWSPDSRQIVFDVKGRLNSNLYVINAEGGAPRQMTSWPSSDQVRPSWSRDGKWIYFGSTRGGGWHIWKTPADASGAGPDRGLQVTAEAGFEAYESVDGSTIYYYRPIGSNRGQLFSMKSAGGPSTRILDLDVSHGWWAVTASGIYFAAIPPIAKGPPVLDAARPLPDPGGLLDFYSFGTRRVTEVGRLDGRINLPTPDFCVSADQRRVIYGRVDEANTNIVTLDGFR